MAVGGGGGNPHTTEKQLVCEDAIFVSIYPILVCLQFFHSEYYPSHPYKFLNFVHQRFVSFLHLYCQRLGFYFCVVQRSGNFLASPIKLFSLCTERTPNSLAIFRVQQQKPQYQLLTILCPTTINYYSTIWVLQRAV